MTESTSPDVIKPTEKFTRFSDHWHPRIIGALNDSYVKLAKIQGEFEWHHHEHEDELFLVLAGRFLMQFRDRDVWVETGELIIVPRGVEHRPVAPDECHIMLIEPQTTLNTGNRADSTLARHDLEWI